MHTDPGCRAAVRRTVHCQIPIVVGCCRDIGMAYSAGRSSMARRSAAPLSAAFALQSICSGCGTVYTVQYAVSPRSCEDQVRWHTLARADALSDGVFPRTPANPLTARRMAAVLDSATRG